MRELGDGEDVDQIEEEFLETDAGVVAVALAQHRDGACRGHARTSRQAANAATAAGTRNTTARMGSSSRTL